jgi:hypothetical protein
MNFFSIVKIDRCIGGFFFHFLRLYVCVNACGLGVIVAEPCEIIVIQRGIKFSIDIDSPARG